MGYLGLDQTVVRDDNMFQRMFWPSDHAGEADTLGKQGFWVCLAIAILSFVVITAQGHWLLGPFTALFFLLGGAGVREHDQPAAVLVAVAYVMNLVAASFPWAYLPACSTLPLRSCCWPTSGAPGSPRNGPGRVMRR